ncbi:MAG TPA: Rieske (2Fe-2S) protein [Cytophagales bacterium]|jgi:cytochrome b6-f complex iron-sulfur subunit
MTRAEFIRSLGLTSGALMAVYCLGGLTACTKEEPKPAAPDNNKLDLSLDLNDSKYSKLKTNGEFVVVTGQPIIVARKADGNFVAVSKDCTHQGGQLSYQAANDRFNCPLHGSNFSTSGAVVNGPATSPLKQYQTELNSAGTTLRVFEA